MDGAIFRQTSETYFDNRYRAAQLEPCHDRSSLHLRVPTIALVTDGTTQPLQLRSCLTTVSLYATHTLPNDSSHIGTMGLSIGPIAACHNVSRGRCSWEEWRCSSEKPPNPCRGCYANRSTPCFSNHLQPVCTLFHHRNHSGGLSSRLCIASQVLILSCDYGASNEC